MLGAALGLGLMGCGKKSSETQSPPAQPKPAQPQTPSQTNAAPKASGNPLTAPVDYLGAAAGVYDRAKKTGATVGIQEAIKQFHTLEGRYPKDLNELVTRNYIPALPKPPAGTKFQYNPSTGQIRLVRVR